VVTASADAKLGLYDRLVLKLLWRQLRGGTRVPEAFGDAAVEALLGAKFDDSMLLALLGDKDSAGGRLVAGLSNVELTVRQREGILRACCSELRGTEVSPNFLDWLAEISGGNLHYSQEGEDILLADLFAGDRVGFFVDVGAHDAQRFSNTYALYRRGWRGINIDASPGSMRSFERLRTRDINVECAVSDADGPLTFHVFSEPALNTFDAALAASYVAAGARFERTLQIVPRPLSVVLDEHLPRGQGIELLNVDVEGLELSVLRSNDWGRHRPEVVILEVLDTAFSDLASNPAVVFLQQQGYAPSSRLTRSMIFRRPGA